MADGANINDVLIAILGVATPIVGAAAVVIKKRFDKKKKAEEDSFLAKHPFFVRVQSLKNHLIYNFSLQNKGKEVVFREMLIANMDIRVNLLRKLCEKIDNEDITTSEELYAEHIKIFQQAIDEFSVYYLDPKFTEDEKKVLRVVIEKFNKWHYKRIEQVPSLLDSVCNSVFYNDVKTKAAVILDTYIAEFISTIQDAQMTLNELNGDLTGLIFKGQRI